MSIGKYDSFDDLAAPAGQMFDWNGYFVEANNVTEDSARRAKARIDSWGKLTKWIAQTHPDIYAALLADNPELLVPEITMGQLAGIFRVDIPASRFHGMGETSITSDTPQTSAGQSLLDKALSVLQSVGTAAIEYDRQKSLLEANIRLAEQGKPLLTSADLATSVSVRNPEIEKLFGYAILGGLALAAVYVAKR